MKAKCVWCGKTDGNGWQYKIGNEKIHIKCMFDAIKEIKLLKNELRRLK